MVNETGGSYVHSTIVYMQLIFLNMKEFDLICVHNYQQSGRGDAHDNDMEWAVRKSHLNRVTSIT